MSVEAQISGTERAYDYFDNITSNIDEIVHETLVIAAKNIIFEARNNLQNNGNINFGDLLASIRILQDDGESIWIGSDMPYAGHIEFGRGPVFPKDPTKWLHWIDKTTGKDVFAKSAKATEPSPFFHPAVISETSKFPDLFVIEFDKKVRI